MHSAAEFALELQRPPMPMIVFKARFRIILFPRSLQLTCLSRWPSHFAKGNKYQFVL